MYQLILGSGSVWRQKVLSDAGYAFSSMSADIDEKAIRHDNATELVLAIAKAKAAELCARVNRRLLPRHDPLLITADQVVRQEVNDVSRIYEKPETPEQAMAMLRSYSDIGFCATVSAVVVTRVRTGEQVAGVDIVEVAFSPIPEERIQAAVERGVVMGSCGAFVHEDPDIAPYIRKMYGPKDSVDGMPLFLLKRLLAPFET